MLDVKVYEIDHSFARSIGVHYTERFSFIQYSAGAAGALAGKTFRT